MIIIVIISYIKQIEKEGGLQMDVYNMTQESIPAVAELMCTMKPEGWDYERF